jgi:hypothetical protein
MTPEEARAMVQDVIKASELPKALLARDSGLSWYTLHSWLTSDRAPSPESLRQLASGLRGRGAKLQELAEQLERTAGEG